MQEISINIHQLILYRKLLNNDVIQKLQELVGMFNYYINKEETIALENCYYDIYYRMIENAEREKISGDLWESFVITLIIKDENMFSLACEKEGQNLSPSLYKLAVHDIKILKKLYQFNWLDIGKKLELDITDAIYNYQTEPVMNNFHRQYLNKIYDLRCLFDKNCPEHELVEHLAEFFYTVGCGKMAKYPAFYWDNGLIGIDNPDPVTLDDLVGCEYQKEILINNTEAFIEGKKANNVLLYGDKGTGKSSSVKALLNKYAGKGLRIVELAKNQLVDFKDIIRVLINRNYYFIIFIDDLSFEDFEVEYKNIKAIIEGSVRAKPDNVLLYVTSNRRHLIKENWSDRQNSGDEVHASDSQQEKLSFADRFGITITYQSPDQQQYLKIVEELAKRSEINMPIDELKQKAIQWEMRYHGRSGRSAQQFITHLSRKYGD